MAEEATMCLKCQHCTDYEQQAHIPICKSCGCDKILHSVVGACNKRQCQCPGYRKIRTIRHCVNCGHLPMDHDFKFDLKVFLNNLVERNKSNALILEYLKDIGITWSERTLKRRLNVLEIKRHEHVPVQELRDIIQQEVVVCGGLAGVRRIYDQCRQKYHKKVKRIDVQEILREVDPEGRKLRIRRALNRRVFKSQGPNWIWSVDGNDKLQFFHIYIHGCIDTFSRKILWLHANTTNKDSKVVAKYFFDTVKTLKVCPNRTRSDPGTENVDLIECQMFLRRNSSDQHAFSNSHIMGPSPLNQGLHRDGWYDRHSCIDKWCMVFVYLPLIQHDIDAFQLWWNNHKIRHQRQVWLPTGAAPNDIYAFPHLYGGHQCGFTVSDRDLAEVAREKTLNYEQSARVPQDFYNEATNFTATNHLTIEISTEEESYIQLRRHFILERSALQSSTYV
ncbi:uncharacterized protein LOC106177367 isoform X2 [Lingula anatina]|uniref:Uncharacterized protein LOC106177367 isoform X2 n=1 Tax=Lingula anatina TaxID=7574 RepID=A0A1S3JYU9_LINAN|nr:uncharacterized protein LOC106177367 isoform X2 [Lingula anatina]|eukprot:XP_013415563.1 uncharacterized protein LOC106177367 isoform X2 [Lingula anatina]